MRQAHPFVAIAEGRLPVYRSSVTGQVSLQSELFICEYSTLDAILLCNNINGCVMFTSQSIHWLVKSQSELSKESTSTMRCVKMPRLYSQIHPSTHCISLFSDNIGQSIYIDWPLIINSCLHSTAREISFVLLQAKTICISINKIYILYFGIHILIG